MARIDNLENFVTDIAGAIRTKTGSSEKIPCTDFDTKILSIPTDSGGGEEQPSCSNQWVRPKEWLPYPEFDETYDEIYLLLNIYNNAQNPIGFKVTGYDESAKYSYNLGTDSSSNIETTFSQTIFHYINWNEVKTANKINEQTKQVWVHIKATRNAIKNINLRMAFTDYPLVKALPVIEYYGNCGKMYDITVGTNSSAYAPATCKELQSIIHSGGFENNRGDYLFAYLPNLQNLNVDLGKMASCARICIGCTSLNKVQLKSVNAQNFNLAFSECPNLFAFPKIDFNSATNVDRMFEKSSLRDVPNINCPNVTTAYNMFSNNEHLAKVGKLEFPNITNTTYTFFNQCNNIISIDDIIMGNMVNGNFIDKNNFNLRSMKLSSYKGANSSSDCLTLPTSGNLMSGEALNQLFESIQTATLPYKIITISGCIGKDDCDITIAENKGYTIVR